jgi:hypothetical protein
MLRDRPRAVRLSPAAVAAPGWLCEPIARTKLAPGAVRARPDAAIDLAIDSRLCVEKGAMR